MIRKNPKFVFAGICFTVCLLTGFFCLLVNKISADSAVLEVSYPSISGQTLSASSTLPDFVLYLFNAGMFLGFFSVMVSLIIAGVMFFVSAANAETLASAKDRASGAISGLLLLVLTYLIVTTINPQLSIFTTHSLTSTTQTTTTVTAPGVSFHESSDCSDANTQPYTSNISDLGNLKNKINSVKIQQDTDNEIYYFTILYNNPDLWGKCEYITTSSSDQGCQSVSPFASSASVYKYEPSPNGDGVYFFRKSCFSDKNYTTADDLAEHCKTGGYYKVSNSEIENEGSSNLYSANLSQLKFIGVPTAEQDCVKYDKTGNCTQRSAPTLGGENISSIIVNGDYIVLLAYKASSGSAGSGTGTTSWSSDSCQEFPTTNDANKTGPRQIKWQNIRNSLNVVPNVMIIIPVQQ